jgi:ketosteroid isomerase-like protein
VDDVERTIRDLTVRLVFAWESCDVERVEPFFTGDPDALFFDAAPLKYIGWAAYKKASVENFTYRFPRQKFQIHDDMIVVHSGDLAVSGFTLHLYTETTDGEPLDADGRCTFVWQRQGERWVIVHEHLSLPQELPPIGGQRVG